MTPLVTDTVARWPRWALRYWPSSRLRVDPLAEWRVDGRYAPVSIANWKLTPPIRARLLAGRVAQPLAFTAGLRLTIVIPYRDRAAHLRQLLPPLWRVLQEQGVRARVLIVEQERSGLFNRGRLLNVGMHYAADFSDYFCLHDVDAVPLVANYSCPSQPLRLVNRIICAGKVTARTDYYFSGAVSLTREHAFAANGYSNDYWGWGKEDDDFFFRLLLAGCLCFYDLEGTFEDLPNPSHQQVVRKSPATPPHVARNRERRSLLLRGLMDPAEDGLGNLRYRVLERTAAADHEIIRVTWDD